MLNSNNYNQTDYGFTPSSRLCYLNNKLVDTLPLSSPLGEDEQFKEYQCATPTRKTNDYEINTKVLSEGEDLGEGCTRRSKINNCPLTPCPSPVGRGGNGFTLAEVLITLVIIGVIAAITVSTLITKYQKEQTVTRLKKAYTTIAQAIYMARINNNLDTYTRFVYPQHTDFATKFLYPYLRIMDTCSSDKTPNCNGTWNYLNNSGTTHPIGGFILDDGTYIGLTCWSFNSERKDFCNISIDVNGIKKGPNIVGKDYFVFQYYLDKNSQLIPYGNNYYTSYLYGNSSQENCHKASHGAFCAALIMKQNWQITDNYPW